jgi:hypothetical protein
MTMHLVGKIALNLLWIGAALFILAASAASAQTYPPTGTSLDAGTTEPTPTAGSTVDVFGVVLDASNNPVAGAEVVFTITSDPGGAQFSNGSNTITALTNESGIATVHLVTGTATGTIVVRVDSNGVVSQVTLSTAGPQALPKTGGQPADSASSLPLAAAAAALGVISIVAGGSLINRSRRPNVGR